MSTTPRALYLAPLMAQHAAEVALLHMAGQPGTFLTALGAEVLGIIYDALPTVPGAFGSVVLDASFTPARVVGFVSATTSTGTLFANVALRHTLRLAPALARACIDNPTLIGRILRTATYPLQSAAIKPQNRKSQSHAELLSIMIAPRLRGTGVGSLLLATLVDGCVARGIALLDVTVDAANSGARRFYARHGFHHHKDFEMYGRAMCQYQRSLFNTDPLAGAPQMYDTVSA